MTDLAPLFVNQKTAAALVGISVRKLQRFQPQPVTYKLGRDRLYKVSELVAWIEGHKQKWQKKSEATSASFPTGVSRKRSTSITSTGEYASTGIQDVSQLRSYLRGSLGQINK